MPSLFALFRYQNVGSNGWKDYVHALLWDEFQPAELFTLAVGNSRQCI